MAIDVPPPLVRTLTTVCWACNQALVFGFCLAAFFSGHRRLSHHRPPVEKSYWNQNFCIGWKNMKVAWEYLAETYLHVKLIVKLPCHNNVCTENTKHVKSLRSAAVAAIVFPPKWSTKIIHQNNAHSHARPRFVFVNGQTTTDVFFFFFCARMFPCMNTTVKPWVRQARGDQLWPAPCQQLLSYKINERKLKSS